MKKRNYIAVFTFILLTYSAANAGGPISWEPSILQKTVCEGLELGIPITLTSQEDLYGATFWINPELTAFVELPGGTFDLNQGVPKDLILLLKIRPSTPIGKYDGSVKVRVNNRVYPNSLNIQIDVVENDRPIALSGPDKAALINDTVSLDGSGSYDVNGDALTYSWSILSKPEDSQASLSYTDIVMPTFSADKPGNYVFELIVNDGLINSVSSTVSIDVFEICIPDTVNVHWDAELTDLYQNVFSQNLINLTMGLDALANASNQIYDNNSDQFIGVDVFRVDETIPSEAYNFILEYCNNYNRPNSIPIQAFGNKFPPGFFEPLQTTLENLLSIRDVGHPGNVLMTMLTMGDEFYQSTLSSLYEIQSIENIIIGTGNGYNGKYGVRIQSYHRIDPVTSEVSSGTIIIIATYASAVGINPFVDALKFPGISTNHSLTPEPTTIVLFGLGLLGFAWAYRRKKL